MMKVIKWTLPLLVIISMALFYGYHQSFFFKPQSIHNWRQSDCASLTLTYAQDGNAWWEPQTHALINDDGTSGKVAPSEIPVYYKMVSLFYGVFGETGFWLRLINGLIFLGGIYSFSLTLIHASKNILWGTLCGALLFTSPVLVYYGNNFLTNAPAFGSALMGLSSWYCFIKTRSKKYFWLFTILFLMAGSLKLPALFLYISICSIEFFSLIRSKKRHLTWRQLIFSAAVVFIPIMSWVFYARYYNHLHHTTYFSTTIFPIWTYTFPEIKEMLKLIWHNWGTSYFHTSLFFLFTVGAIVFLIPGVLKQSLFKHLLYPLLSLATVYFVLQFYTFRDHDYYTINMFIIPAIVLLIISERISHFGKTSAWVSVIPAAFLGINAMHAKSNLNWRYSDYINEIKTTRPFLYEDDIDLYLTSIGVMRYDTIIYLREGSHTPLYLLNRKGWTDHKMKFRDGPDMYFNRDSAQIAKSIANGAKYLLIGGPDDANDLMYIRPFTKKLLGVHNGLYVFDVHGPDSINYFGEEYHKPLIKDEFDKEPYMGRLNIGAYRMLPETEYAKDFDLDSLIVGAQIQVTVWRSYSRKKVIPVIQSGNGGSIFKQEVNVVDTYQKWQKLLQKHTVTPQDTITGLKIFLWNPEHDTAYFDDLEIKMISPKP